LVSFRLEFPAILREGRIKRTTLRGMLKFLEISYQEFPFINLTLLPKCSEFLVEWHGSLFGILTISGFFQWKLSKEISVPFVLVSKFPEVLFG